MTREEYLAQRQGLMNKAKEAITNGKPEEAKTHREAIEALDTKFSTIAAEEANINALSNQVIGGNAQNIAVGAGNAIAVDSKTANSEENIENAYREAFACVLMGRKVTDQQQEVIDAYNSRGSAVMNATETTSDNSMLVPESVVNKIWESINEQHAIIRDIMPTHVPGAVTLIRDDETDGDGSWVDETDSGDEANLSFAEVNLNGCELAKGVMISWKLKKMSIPAFLEYLGGKIAKKMGNALANGYLNGQGQPGQDDSWKPQPTGIITALEAEASTPQVTTYSTEDPAYTDITAMLAKIKAGGVTKIYASYKTIWGDIANIKDSNGRPYFIPNTATGGVGSILGCVIEREDKVPEHGILAGDASCYGANVNEDIVIYQEDHVKDRKTYYMGYALIDGAPIVNGGFSYLKKSA